MKWMSAALAAALLAAPCGAWAQTAAGSAARATTFAKLPYWSGYWVSERQAGTTIGGSAPTRDPNGGGGQTRGQFMSLAGFGAPWNDEGKKRQAAARAKAGGRKANGWGYPMMMDAAAPFQVLITPEEVLIINPYGDVRHIYTDGRKMPAAEDMWPTVWGTSIGHWEGDTLVIETVQVKNPNDYFHGGPPLSENATYHERVHMDGQNLIDEVTIEDPTLLTGPWKSTVYYVRDTGFDRMIQIDFDNDRTGVDANGINTIEPPADER